MPESGNFLSSVNRGRSEFSANAIYDPTLDGGNGGWRPLLPADLGNAPSYDAVSVSSYGFVSGLVAKASPGYLLTIQGYNSKATSQFIHVFDASGIPPVNSVPAMIFNVAASSNFNFDFNFGAPFQIGIVLANSSSGAMRSGGAADVSYYIVRK